MNTTLKQTLKTTAKGLFIATALAVGTPFALAVDPLSVSGNQVLAGGKHQSFGGMSLFWSNNGWGGDKFYNASAVADIKNNFKGNIVRAAMGVEDPGGYFEDPAGNEARVRAVVEAAIANDMYVIIDWHSHHAHEHDWSRAIDFFQRMARDYGHTDNVIYEVYNEPLGVSWHDIKGYAEAVAGAIRQIDPDNLIVVGTPQWSQKVNEASYSPINLNNIAYTLHFYAGTHKQGLRDIATEAMNNGIALFATEWGTVNANGDGGVDHGSTDQWMNFLKTNNISHANWAYNDKGEGASALAGWGGLTESGNKVRDILHSWPTAGNNTGNPTTPTTGNCSVFVVPGTIQAEDYCDASGIEIETTSDTGGGQNVGWIDTGDWMSYNINVPTAGTYKVSYRVAAMDSSALQFEAKGGAPVYGVVDIPAQNGWQNWTTISHEVDLPAGEQSVAIAATFSGWNLNWFSIEEVELTCGDCCYGNCPPPPPPPSTGNGVPAMTVSGNRVLVGGQEISLGGNSLFWSNDGWGAEAYYNANVVKWLKDDWKSSIIRAPMGIEDGGGYFDSPASNEARVRTIIDAAIANDMYVIVDWHSHHANEHDWSKAVTFFQGIARDYGDKNNIIYEVFNEPLQVDFASDIKPYAETVINAIRAIDPDNLIVVGTSTWSQDVDHVAWNKINATNIAYTLHFYVGMHGQFLRDKATNAMNNGVALFATEWGIHEWDWNELTAWMDFLKNNKISHANWSVHHKLEPYSSLHVGVNPNGGWTASDLTQSGTTVRDYLRGWPQIPGTVTPPPPTGGSSILIEAEGYTFESGTQTEATSDNGGGLNVGWLDAGDWMAYHGIAVPQAGQYEIEFRVASQNGGGELAFERAGGTTTYAVVAVPSTGGWQNWVTVKATVNLDAGTQDFGIGIRSGGFNLNWIKLNKL